MKSFWFFWIFDAIMSLVPIYFFFAGLADGTVSARNMGIWMLILAIVAVVLGGSYYLMTHQQPGLARALVILGSVPGWILILYALVIIIGKPRWN